MVFKEDRPTTATTSSLGARDRVGRGPKPLGPEAPRSAQGDTFLLPNGQEKASSDAVALTTPIPTRRRSAARRVDIAPRRSYRGPSTLKKIKRAWYRNVVLTRARGSPSSGIDDAEWAE